MSPIDKFTISIIAVVILLTANNLPSRSFAADPPRRNSLRRDLLSAV